MTMGAGVVGVISERHGLLGEEVLRALEGSDLIIHTGDVGDPAILDHLGVLAPVVAVRGNIDKGAWASALPMTAIVEAGSVVIYIIHNVHDLDLDAAAAGFQIVISGHSHKPERTERCGVL